MKPAECLREFKKADGRQGNRSKKSCQPSVARNHFRSIRGRLGSSRCPAAAGGSSAAGPRDDPAAYVDMMVPGAVQLLAPVLPPMARARTRYVLPGTRLVITIRMALDETQAFCQVTPLSALIST